MPTCGMFRDAELGLSYACLHISLDPSSGSNIVVHRFTQTDDVIHHYSTCLFCVLQECDQVHIDDVSSDDNGQDLRYKTESL